MHKTLSYIAFSTLLGLAFVAGCCNRTATESTGGAAQTSGAEGIITKGGEGKEWVTPDAEYAGEQAAENGAEDYDETGLVSPMTAPGMNEVQ
jgi:hypothetical protein